MKYAFSLGILNVNSSALWVLMVSWTLLGSIVIDQTLSVFHINLPVVPSLFFGFILGKIFFQVVFWDLEKR